MMDEATQVKYEEKVKSILALAKKKKNVLEYQEIQDHFLELALTEEQFARVVETLETSGVDVLRITSGEEDEVLIQRRRTQGRPCRRDRPQCRPDGT